jgi:spermidine synthase
MQIPLNNPKVEVLNKDAFVWAKNTKKQYDVGGGGLSRSFKLQFRKVVFLEFFSTLKQILTPDAVVVVQTTSPYFAPNRFGVLTKP